MKYNIPDGDDPRAGHRRGPVMILARSGIVVLVVLAGALACRTAPILNVTDAPVPPGLTADQVRDAITRGAEARKWSVTDAGPGRLVADLSLRGHQASVYISYSERSYSIQYRDSHDLDYDGTEIHKNYNGWIINMQRSIDQELATARSAAQPHGY